MLDERKIMILAAIIDDYIATAEPIGSRTIARKYRIGISPATIRNEMADLEELGYLFQPHTSAGRIPSNKAYRFYVDSLLPLIDVDTPDMALIQQLFDKRVNELEELVEQAAKVISKLTSYTTITLGPQLEASNFKHIQLSRIEDTKGLLIVITNYGTISHHIIDIPSNLNDSDFIRISNVLNHNLAGKAISELTSETKETIKNEMIEYDQILNILMDILVENVDDVVENTLVVSTGRSKMLEHPEFRDVEKAKKFLHLLEQHDLITKALKTLSKPNNIIVTIGNEHRFVELQEFSIVTASFTVENKNLGTFGIMGPTRMEYLKVISILQKVTEYLNKYITELI